MNNNNKLSTESIKQILNQSITQMDASTLDSLRAARNRALESHRALQHAPILAWLNQHGMWIGSPAETHKKMSWMLAFLFIICLAGGVAYMEQNSEHEHSEIDIAILTDDLPIDAYVE